MTSTAEPDAKQWLFEMISSLREADLIRCLVTLWAIWHARRKAIHEDVFQSPLSTYAFVESYLRDLEIMSQSNTTIRSSGRKGTVERKWIAPPAGWVKINVDAALNKQQNGGAIAAVCRSEDGDYLGASAIVVQGITDPAVMEALACREAMSLAKDLHLQRIHIASDCLEVVSSMGQPNLGRFSTILQEIETSRRDFSAVNFVHEHRSANVEAHGLARSSTSLDNGRHLWLLHTPDAFCIPLKILN
jgi:ribonuclease HI